MKVALISAHSFVSPGGVKTHILGLYKEFRKKGIKTKILVPRRKLKEKYFEDVILLGTSFPIRFGGGVSDIDINFNPISVERVLRKEKFDILHFHNFSFPSGMQILLSPITFKTLNILTFHSDISRSKFFQKFPQVFKPFVKFCNWRIDGIIAVSKVAYEVFKDYKGPKIILPNGVDLEKFNPKTLKIEKYLDGKINILFVGRIEKRKGLIYLLRAYEILQKKFNNLRLIVVGDGPQKEKCQKYAREHNLKEVIFEDAKEDPSPYFATSHIFCAPSIFGESFGVVILEAMASGLPVVAFANQGYRSWLKGKKGKKLLVPTKDVKKLAQKIEILIENPRLREEMGKWGRSEAKKYSFEKIANKVLEFYRFCQKQKSKR